MDSDMTLLATEIEPGFSGPQPTKGSVVDQAHWGYVIRDAAPASLPAALLGASGRFVGTLLLMTAGGLLLLPDSVQGPGLEGMKLAAMVVFTTLGLILFFAGGSERHPEVHIDTVRGEVRLGWRERKTGFRNRATLSFDDVASVFLLRSKDQSRPTRMFLRLVGEDMAMEIASGPEAAMEALRARLSRDLARDPRQPVAVDLPRPMSRVA